MQQSVYCVHVHIGTHIHAEVFRCMNMNIYMYLNRFVLDPRSRAVLIRHPTETCGALGRPMVILPSPCGGLPTCVKTPLTSLELGFCGQTSFPGAPKKRQTSRSLARSSLCRSFCQLACVFKPYAWASWASPIFQRLLVFCCIRLFSTFSWICCLPNQATSR